MVTVVVIVCQPAQEHIVGQTAVGIAFRLGGQVLVLCLVDHCFGHLGKMHKGGNLIGAQVVETKNLMFIILLGDSQFHRVGLHGIDGLQHFGAEKMTA